MHFEVKWRNDEVNVCSKDYNRKLKVKVIFYVGKVKVLLVKEEKIFLRGKEKKAAGPGVAWGKFALVRE